MRVALLLLVTAVGGCQCKIDPINLNGIHDAGTPIHDAGPPPPKFPLKAGDVVKFPVLGGRTQDTCAGHNTPGDCQLGLTAEYDITSVKLDSATETFQVQANVTYTATPGNLIDDAAIKALLMEKIAPFGTATDPNQPQTGTAVVFTTNSAITSAIKETDFPFFQFDPAAPQIFNAAADDFKSTYLGLDAQAKITTQSAANLMEVFYKDSQAGAKVELHKLHIEYLKFGFIGGWDEEMVPFVDDTTTPRDESTFQNSTVPDLAAQFFPPTLTRDNNTYSCDTFSQKCTNFNVTPATCLNPDPDVAPGPC
jgi:hypothetical protein